MAGAEPDAFFDHSPMIGRANPLAPPIALELSDNLVVGRVRFGSAYEGPPGCVHGGYVACAFDEILGAAQTFSGAPGMTGTLTIRYRKPTPLHADLRFEGRFDRKEGRKVFTSGQLYAGDLLTAEAEGIFVSIPAERFAQLRADRGARRPASAPFTKRRDDVGLGLEVLAEARDERLLDRGPDERRPHLHVALRGADGAAVVGLGSATSR